MLKIVERNTVSFSGRILEKIPIFLYVRLGPETIYYFFPGSLCFTALEINKRNSIEFTVSCLLYQVS